MNDLDKMHLKIMFGLLMRGIFLVLRCHGNNATKLSQEFQAYIRPGGSLDQWGTPVPDELRPKGKEANNVLPDA